MVCWWVVHCCPETPVNTLMSDFSKGPDLRAKNPLVLEHQRSFQSRILAGYVCLVLSASILLVRDVGYPVMGHPSIHPSIIHPSVPRSCPPRLGISHARFPVRDVVSYLTSPITVNRFGKSLNLRRPTSRNTKPKSNRPGEACLERWTCCCS
jgi:hypothetical protein